MIVSSNATEAYVPTRRRPSITFALPPARTHQYSHWGRLSVNGVDAGTVSFEFDPGARLSDETFVLDPID